MAIITLLTDFGHSDEYVGVMKGVILSIDDDAKIIDLTHLIDPQDISQAAYLIKASYSYFPRNTIHVVVVDPGVGTNRRIIALKINGHFFIAPDNGVLSLLWQNQRFEGGVWVNNSKYFAHVISHTFHGRDIIAPVAGWLSMKTPMSDLGPPVEISDLNVLRVSNPKISDKNTLEGMVILIDHFGNLLTNIEAKMIFQLCQRYPEKMIVVKVGKTIIKGLSTSYETVPEKQALVIIGSRGYLEIAVNCGNASKILNVYKKDPVTITLATQ